MSAPPPSDPFPMGFVIVTFAASIAIGVAIVYFGLRAQLGWGIP
jgi:hypothetical protein